MISSQATNWGLSSVVEEEHRTCGLGSDRSRPRRRPRGQTCEAGRGRRRFSFSGRPDADMGKELISGGAWCGTLHMRPIHTLP